jgi:hypothetical protein
VRIPVVIVSSALPTVTDAPYYARMSDTPGPGSEEPSLSAQDRAVLALERRGWPPGGGTKERVIRERLEMSPTRYYQLLNALLDDPSALAHDPVTVNRLRRIRDERRAQR